MFMEYESPSFCVSLTRFADLSTMIFAFNACYCLHTKQAAKFTACFEETSRVGATIYFGYASHPLPFIFQ